MTCRLGFFLLASLCLQGSRAGPSAADKVTKGNGTVSLRIARPGQGNLRKPATAQAVLHPNPSLGTASSHAAVKSSKVVQRSAVLVRSTKANATAAGVAAAKSGPCQPCGNAQYTLKVNVDDYDALTAGDGCGTSNCASHWSVLCDCYGTQVCKEMYQPDDQGAVSVGNVVKSFSSCESLDSMMCDAMEYMKVQNPSSDSSCEGDLSLHEVTCPTPSYGF